MINIIVKSIDLIAKTAIDKNNEVISLAPLTAYLVPFKDGTTEHERYVTDENIIVSKQVSGEAQVDTDTYITPITILTPELGIIPVNGVTKQSVVNHINSLGLVKNEKEIYSISVKRPTPGWEPYEYPEGTINIRSVIVPNVGGAVIPIDLLPGVTYLTDDLTGNNVFNPRVLITPDVLIPSGTEVRDLYPIATAIEHQRPIGSINFENPQLCVQYSVEVIARQAIFGGLYKSNVCPAYEEFILSENVIENEYLITGLVKGLVSINPNNLLEINKKQDIEMISGEWIFGVK